MAKPPSPALLRYVAIQDFHVCVECSCIWVASASTDVFKGTSVQLGPLRYSNSPPPPFPQSAFRNLRTIPSYRVGGSLLFELGVQTPDFFLLYQGLQKFLQLGLLEGEQGVTGKSRQPFHHAVIQYFQSFMIGKRNQRPEGEKRTSTT